MSQSAEAGCTEPCPLEWERGAHSQNHCTAQHTFTMTSQTKITSYGVRLNTSVRTRRAEATPGARTPPPNTTAGQKSPSQDTRIRRPKGKKPTGQLRKEKPIRVMHWNAEGVFHKVEELRNILVEKDIDICCIQETHLTEAKNLKIRGYQKPFRLDRKDRHKGGILTLVRNNIHAAEGCTNLDGAEYQFSK